MLAGREPQSEVKQSGASEPRLKIPLTPPAG